ncbi:MAG: hypothetical protein P4N41_15910 [Negativicutes bacterium]|nr:hypothetical protein [Negativicutes bacterium]
MTHTLHRRGTDESLKNDYVLLVTAASGINHEGSREKLLKVLEVVWEVGPANVGSQHLGTILQGYSLEEIKAALNEVPRVRCSFSSKEKIREIIRRLKELDLGMSVTVEGPTEDLITMSEELGIKPHSVNLSLDIWGKKGELPAEEVLEFVTMCGHGLISQHLVKKVIEEVKAGRKSPEKAAVQIGIPCVCGIYNPDRAVELLQKYVPKA